MEINITSFFENADAFEFSASVAERGKNAGPETWNNAKEEATRAPLLTTPEQLEALREHVKEFGAWERDEIDAWDSEHCNALFIQLVAGDIREAGLDSESDSSDWRRYERRVEAGNCSGNLYKTNEGAIFYSLGM